MTIKLKSSYKGTRILYGESARIKRELINKMIYILYKEGFEEIQIPIIQLKSSFYSKVGEENRNMMFEFIDRGNREVVLSPEYTSICQQIAKETFKPYKNKKVFYVQECFRNENPQYKRYRQFTQLGVEILNSTVSNDLSYLMILAKNLIELQEQEVELNKEVTRGLDYYKNGKGFEIRNKEGLQLCGGGSYDSGIGFAIGIDRLI